MDHFRKINSAHFLIKSAFLWAIVSGSTSALSFTANSISMEFRDNGRYRVYVNYTVPSMREMREIYVEFSKKKEAEKYYFDLARGADFYLPDAKQRKFIPNRKGPDPW